MRVEQWWSPPVGLGRREPEQDNPAQASTSLHYLIRDKQTQILSPSENIQRRQMFEITRNLQKL